MDLLYFTHWSMCCPACANIGTGSEHPGVAENIAPAGGPGSDIIKWEPYVKRHWYKAFMTENIRYGLI